MMRSTMSASRDRSQTAAILVSSIAVACGERPDTPVDAGPVAFSEIAMAEGELVFVAGHEESRPGHVLHRTGRVLRVAPDTFVVVHRGDNEILVFSGDGTLQRTLGGRGAGPGEFLALEDGRLWARQFPDPGSRTAVWQVYGSSGGVIGSVMLPSAFRPHWADDDEIVGVLTGLHDVEAVVRLRSFRLEPASGR